MEAAITFRVPPELTLDEDQKGQLSGLVQTKLEETKTLTLVSTDEQFETTGEQLKIIAYIREVPSQICQLQKLRQRRPDRPRNISLLSRSCCDSRRPTDAHRDRILLKTAGFFWF